MNHEIHCQYCDRYIATAVGTVLLEQLPCPNSKCRAKLNIKVIDANSTHEQMHYKFKTAGIPPKDKETT